MHIYLDIHSYPSMCCNKSISRLSERAREPVNDLFPNNLAQQFGSSRHLAQLTLRLQTLKVDIGTFLLIK